MTPRVLLYAQHILGIGHLVRASRVARAMQAAAMDVVVALGGMPVAGVDWGTARLEYLPPIRAGAKGYADLVDAQGRPVDDALREARRRRLSTLVQDERPDIVVIEAFPFGRRAMRFELIPVLEMVRGWDTSPIVASSLRDILHENRKARLNMETVDLVERLFDLVLVHGDPELIALDASFPECGRIAAKVRYTGIVAPPAGRDLSGRGHDVVVSAGGGAVGEALLRTALQALPLCAARQASWCLVTGPNLDAGTVEALQGQAPANVTIERFRSDFAALIHRADLSISQAGYNTVADILAARCPAVLVPSAYQGETEQTRRAHLLRARGLAQVVEERDLDARSLATAIDAAWGRPRLSDDLVPDLDGAAATARVLIEALENR